MRKAIDLTGQRFGRLIVLKNTEERDKYNYTLWLCKCDCGKTRVVNGGALKSGNTISCGCYKKEKSRDSRTIDLAGKRFGALTAIRPGGNIKGDI
jgi:hypothetical protein